MAWERNGQASKGRPYPQEEIKMISKQIDLLLKGVRPSMASKAKIKLLKPKKLSAPKMKKMTIKNLKAPSLKGPKRVTTPSLKTRFGQPLYMPHDGR